MNDSPKISVVIPFYNAEKFLNTAIDSVLNQNFTNFEIILVNDGSMDNSLLISKTYCKENRRCKLISIPNSGPGIARNKGVEIAQGSYLLFLDADDRLPKNALKDLYCSMIENNTDLCIGRHQMLDKNNIVLKEVPNFKEKVISSHQVIEKILKSEIIPTSWAKLYVTELVKKTPFPNLFWKEDDVFLLRYLNKTKTISLINKVVLINVCRTNSLTRSKLTKKMVLAIFTSYSLQHQLMQNSFEKLLYKQKLNSLILVYLLLNIDWNVLQNEDRKQIIKTIQFYTKQIKNNKHANFNLKNRITLFILNTSNILGIQFVLRLLSIVKQKKIKELKTIKN